MNMIEGLQSSCPKTAMMLEIIGLLIVFKKMWRLITNMYRLMRRRRNLKQRYGAGSWAFITGSSEGIGKATALSLAKQGFNIILSARTQKKLEAVRQQIQEKYPSTEVKILVADYSKSHQWSFLTNLLDQISMLDISIVVNNAGVDVIDYFAKINPEKVEQLIKLNCFSCALITRYFIPILIERNRTKKLKSTIVNVSSVAGVLPIALLNVYSASKSFVDTFTRSVAYEYPEIDFLSLRPSQVSTPMTANKQVDILTITAEQCAEGLVDELGQGQKVTYGHWRHQLQGWLYEMIPERFFNYVYLNYVGPDEMKQRQNSLKKLS